jgi:hypothetical protein
VAGEVVLRLIGFGDPPVFNTHPRIEYYAKEGSYRRYGNYMQINQFGMRGAPVEQRGKQLRVLLIGDSIVFGTYRVNQDELISSFLGPELARLTERKVEVLNAACWSWGPENQLAYLQQFGTFDADTAVWVLSSHDAYDVPVPGFSDTLPKQSPFLAIVEVLELLEQKRFQGPAPAGDPLLRSLGAVTQVVELLKRRKIPLLVVQHWSVQELEAGMHEGGQALKQHFEQLGVPTFSLDSALRHAMAQGLEPYQDRLHVEASGAEVIGVAVAKRLVSAGDSLLPRTRSGRP